MSKHLEVHADEGCADLARRVNTQLAGSAARVSAFWLKVEPARWPKKAEALLSPEEMAKIASVDGSRLQLIRRPGDRVAGGLEVVELDYSLRAQRFLICTHGQRDLCCSKYGMAAFRAVQDDAQVWQTSHLGGHRFAATMSVVPDGYAYGWLEPDDMKPVIEAHRRGELGPLGSLRGNHRFDSPSQVAEIEVRRHLNENRIDAALAVEGTIVDEVWSGRVQLFGQAWSVELRRETGQARPKSCGADPTPMIRWVLVSEVQSVE